MLVVCGDLHLSDSRPWSWEVSNKIVDFILDHSLNNEINIAIFVGDITEDAFLSGQVFDLMVKLFSQLKFSHTYVLVGNHDLKKNKQGQLTLSFKFLKRKVFQDKVTVVESPDMINIRFDWNHFKVLMLPWFPNNMKETYEHLQGVDNPNLIVGHFQDPSVNIPGETINIDYLKPQFICLGHIHDKHHPRYIGSIVPNSVEGAGLPRYIRTYSLPTGMGIGNLPAEETLVPIPHIMDYCFVNFPDPLPKVDTEIPVWTIYNCADEATARAHYGDIYIRDTIFDVSMDKEAFRKINTSGKKSLSIEDMYTEWEKKAQYDPSILKLARGYFMSG
jgi:Calcineurin-like phosphoesterase